MENNKLSKNHSRLIAILCALLYFTSYMTRKSFSAIKLGLPDTLGDIALGNIGSALFFTYGVGQIVSGILADRTKPEYLIYSGLGLSALSNLLFPVLIDFPIVLTVVWGVNGFAQALFWPPILGIMAKYLHGSSRSSVSVVPPKATNPPVPPFRSAVRARRFSFTSLPQVSSQSMHGASSFTLPPH